MRDLINSIAYNTSISECAVWDYLYVTTANMLITVEESLDSLFWQTKDLLRDFQSLALYPRQSFFRLF